MKSIISLVIVFLAMKSKVKYSSRKFKYKSNISMKILFAFYILLNNEGSHEEPHWSTIRPIRNQTARADIIC